MKNIKPYDNYKDSAVDWLGDIPEHWEARKTKHLFKLMLEQAPVGNNEELLSIYTALGVKPRKELEERGNRATTTDNYWRVKKQDIIVNKLLAWMGAIGISEYDGVTSPAYDILRSKGEANPYFYTYLFRSPLSNTEFKRHSRGIMDVRLRLYFNRFGDIKLPFPPIEEQNQIVAFIKYKVTKTNLFILKKKKLIKLLNEQKAAIINQAVTKGLDANARMKPSGIDWLGDIPEHWEVKKLKHLARVKTGRTPKIESSLTDYFENGDVDWFTPGDFGSQGLLNDSKRKISIAAVNDNQVEMFPPRTVYLIGIGTIGKTGYSEIEASANQQINAIIFRSSVNPKFGFYFLQVSKFQAELLANFTTLPILNQSKTKEIIIAVPNTYFEQTEIVEYIEKETATINLTISTIEKEIALVQEYRTTLIAEAVTGKIDVRGYEIPTLAIDEEIAEEFETDEITDEEYAEARTE